MHTAAPFRDYWGKAKPESSTTPTWHPFAFHALDVVAVAAALWHRSKAIRGAFANAFEIPESQADELEAWVLFFIALHDFGKLHAWFQSQAPEAMAVAWPELNPSAIANRRGSAVHFPHGSMGYQLLKQRLAERLGVSGREARARWKSWEPWAAAVTGHHGELPGEADIGTLPKGYAETWVQDRDAAAQIAWLDQAAELLLRPKGLTVADIPPVCSDAARGLLAGFCSLCDWVGSNTTFFPYAPPGQPEHDYLDQRRRDVDRLDLLTHLGLTAVPAAYLGLGALLRDGECPRGVQLLVDTLPLEGGLTIIEAPTGSGKTEAALAIAWRLLAAGAADSVVFALPTQATANAMLPRAERFAAQVFGQASLVLAHGNSRINPEFRRLVEAGRQATVQGREEAAVHCAEWLASSRKRVFLGQIGVCTVDQTLLSVLPVRHGFVRGFGLSRSVLIVDEVHAYDAYMHGLLGEVLRRQKAAGGSAILLSATLPSGVRAGLLGAWGARAEGAAPYPAIWPAHSGATTAMALSEHERPTPRPIRTERLILPDAFPDDATVERMVAAARDGALVGVVMNTVDAAQRLARALRDGTDLTVDLFHARYRLEDRQRIEREVIQRYGRDAERGSGRILVATQVIEQSLDLDFDWLLTQICPVDLLFQRIGRLHRHPRRRPPGYESPLCTVLCPGGKDYGVSELIYRDPRPLWRTEHLIAASAALELPAAYREWIERVYAEDPWEDEPEDEDYIGKHEACRFYNTHVAAEARKLAGMSIRQFRDSDEIAAALTRDGEMGLTVLPVRSTGALLDGTTLDSLDEYQRAEALLLASVPAPRSWEKLLAGLEHDEDGRIRLILEPSTPGTCVSAERTLVYSTDLGLAKIEIAEE